MVWVNIELALLTETDMLFPLIVKLETEAVLAAGFDTVAVFVV